jgi:hypothetical protein
MGNLVASNVEKCHAYTGKEFGHVPRIIIAYDCFTLVWEDINL